MRLRPGLPVANASTACCCFSVEKRMKDQFVWQRRCSSSVASVRWRSIPPFLRRWRMATRSQEKLMRHRPQSIKRSEITGERWCAAELLRIKGDILLLQDEPDATSAGDFLRESLDAARRHGALSWELRATINLVRLPPNGRRRQDARGLLSRIYDRYTEGFETTDLAAARLLLGWGDGHRVGFGPNYPR